MSIDPFDTAPLEEVVAKWKNTRGNLIMILHEIQNQYGYVPRSIALILAQSLDVPLAQIYEVITFYHFFKLSKPGKYVLSVCTGTACYLKGSQDIVDEIESLLNIKDGQTSSDGMFHLQSVRCLGCCGLAPVLMVNQTIHGKVKKEEVASLLSFYKKQG